MIILFDFRNYSEVTLTTIPIEIFLHICEFLEAGELISTLAKVCQAFYDLLTNEAYWRIRLTKRWPKKYPPVQCKYPFLRQTLVAQLVM